MEKIEVIIADKVASVTGKPKLICGNSDYIISFTFDAEWDDEENKVARFTFCKNGLKKFIDVPITENTCKVPILSGIELVTVGVYAGNLKTTTGANIRCKKSILCDTAEEDTDVIENLFEMIKEYISAIGQGSNINLIHDIDLEAEYGENDAPSMNALVNILLMIGENFATTEYVNKVKEDVNAVNERLTTHIQYQDSVNQVFIEKLNALNENMAIVNEISILVGGAG